MPFAATAPDHYAPPRHSAAGRAWRWLTALAIGGAIAVNAYSVLRPFAGQTQAVVSAKYPTLLTPAGMAFSIWGVIFLALLVYAGWQLLPAQRELSLPDALAKPLTLTSIGLGAWVVLFAYELILPSAGIMFLLLASTAMAYGRARRRIFADAAPRLAGVPLSLLLGWLSVAAVINFTIAIRTLGWQTADGASVTLTLGLMVAVVVLGLLMSRVFRDLVFPLVIAWALVWVWVARLREIPELGWAALIGATVVAIAGPMLSRLGDRKTAWQLRDEAAAAAEAEIAARNAARD
ncbi:MAG: hypothetical protein M3Y12_12130 [Bacteroidota bacterium]|nr:hypothetical protein [Bacteroidota bacterium]